MKSILTILALIITSQASADQQADDLLSTIRSKAAASERGVIVALDARGQSAANTAWLLAEQTQPGSGYAPYLLIVKAEDRKHIYSELKVPETSSPVLLIFDQQGHEISRITNVRPAQLPWQPRSQSEENLVAFRH